MSERIDQNQQTNPGNTNDPLAELARIVAGEDPVQVVMEKPVAVESEPASGVQADMQVDFSVDLEQELMQEFNPSSEPQAVPVAQAQARAEQTPAASGDFDFEASLENQLMQELDVGEATASQPQPAREIAEPAPFISQASMEPDIQAETMDASFQGLQEVETLAEEFASEAAIEAAADYGDYKSQQEFASEVAPSVSADPLGYEAGTAIADSISSDLGADVDAKFEQIAKQAADEDYQHSLTAGSGGEPNLEAEFESAFASELDQNDILPDTSSSYAAPSLDGQWDASNTGDAQREFAAAFPSADGRNAGEASILGSPEHLDDPSIFDESALDGNLGAAISPPPRRSGFKMAALALGIALLVGFGAVGYGFLSNDGGDGDPIVVMADPGDVKVKPEDRGGVVIANQDNASYAELSGNTDEPIQDTLFSGTEIANEPPSVSALEPKAEERLSPGSSESISAPTAIAPRKVRTFTVKPDGTILTPDAPLEVASLEGAAQTRSLTPLQPTGVPLEIQPSVSTLATDAPLIEAPTPVAITKVEPPVSIVAPAIVRTQSVAVAEPQVSTEIVNIAPEPIDGATAANGNIAVPEQSPLPKPIKVAAEVAPRRVVQQAPVNNNAPVKLASTPAQAIPNSTTSSPWAIQISSQRSREAADSSYLNLKRRFPNLLNGRSVDIREAQVSGKGTFFRVRIQADSKAAAANFCTRFKSSGGSCFITR